MNMNDFKPCKCVFGNVTWGAGYEDEKYYIYAKCVICKREKIREIHADTYHSLTVDYAHKLAVDLWNGEEAKEDETENKGEQR